jgi:hypothetical protein
MHGWMMFTKFTADENCICWLTLFLNLQVVATFVSSVLLYTHRRPRTEAEDCD